MLLCVYIPVDTINVRLLTSDTTVGFPWSDEIYKLAQTWNVSGQSSDGSDSSQSEGRMGGCGSREGPLLMPPVCHNYRS